jgi:4-hydroxy-3-polyprenylbenzoate decarboxylase
MTTALKKRGARMASERKYYRDFREHLKALEERGQLVRVRREINKDTELMPLVRWQFRGLEERERKAFLFENVIDSKGRRYAMPVTVGTLAATTEIYAIGMMCEPDEIAERWTQAQLNPIEPVTVSNAPVHEVVQHGSDLLNGHGLDMIPVPISTPGFDNAPYLTSANWITKDLDTGIYNIGNYRSQIKSANRTGGLFTSQHMGQHRLFRHGEDPLRLRRVSPCRRPRASAGGSGPGEDCRFTGAGDCGDYHRGNHPDRRGRARRPVR